MSVSFLPPICVEFALPANYPSEAPPINRVTCNWLTPAQVCTGPLGLQLL